MCIRARWKVSLVLTDRRTVVRYSTDVRSFRLAHSLSTKSKLSFTTGVMVDITMWILFIFIHSFFYKFFTSLCSSDMLMWDVCVHVLNYAYLCLCFCCVDRIVAHASSFCVFNGFVPMYSIFNCLHILHVNYHRHNHCDRWAIYKKVLFCFGRLKCISCFVNHFSHDSFPSLFH